MKTLFAGPFMGEFGYELFRWQSHLRFLSESFDKTIISSRPSSEFLYDDFCDEFIPYDPASYNCSSWLCMDKKYKEKIHEKFNPDTIVNIENLKQGREFVAKNKEKFHMYGDPNAETNIDIVIHARAINEGEFYKKQRNWNSGKWENLVRLLNKNDVKIASIGLSEVSLHVPGTENMRDIDSKKLCDILRNAKMILGPSSGPMHLATLCNCPQFVWTPSFNKERYEKKWNPFFTPVCVYDAEGWDPKPKNIVNGMCKFMEEIL